MPFEYLSISQSTTLLAHHNLPNEYIGVEHIENSYRSYVVLCVNRGCRSINWSSISYTATTDQDMFVIGTRGTSVEGTNGAKGVKGAISLIDSGK